MQFAEIVTTAMQVPFTSDLLFTPHHEPVSPLALLRLPEHRLHGLASQAVEVPAPFCQELAFHPFARGETFRYSPSERRRLAHCLALSPVLGRGNHEVAIRRLQSRIGLRPITRVHVS